MNNLFIKSTEYTPDIFFDADKHILEITGVSRPENVTEYYSPIIDWMTTYESVLYKNHVSGGKKETIHLIFKFSYFNSASSKMIYTLLDSLTRIKEMGYPIHIDWYSEIGDDQMHEDGEELSEAIDVPFNFFEH